MANKSIGILVTGSAGFLGAPLTHDLLSKGYKIIGIDNYSNSNSKNTNKLKEIFNQQYQFYEIDLASNFIELNKVFKLHKPQLVMHLAALKSVQESMNNPNLYKNNNIKSTVNILNSMASNNCKKIIYSSSAAVYGNQKEQPISENAVLRPTSIYAETKLSCEKLIEDASKKQSIDGLSLRYFNPIGSHSSKLYREELGLNTGSIMQEIIKVALKRNNILNIFGSDYETEDGTCERDFIHIDDVLDAHIKSIKYLESYIGYNVFNIGTGKSISILKLVNAFIEQNKISIKYKFVNKKSEDIQTSYANVAKIKDTIRWKAKKNLNTMVKESWEAYCKDKI